MAHVIQIISASHNASTVSIYIVSRFWVFIFSYLAHLWRNAGHGHASINPYHVSLRRWPLQTSKRAGWTLGHAGRSWANSRRRRSEKCDSHDRMCLEDSVRLFLIEEFLSAEFVDCCWRSNGSLGWLKHFSGTKSYGEWWHSTNA